MTSGLMRRLFSSSSRAGFTRFPSTALTVARPLGLKQYQRSIANVRARQASVARTWFTSSTALLYPEGAHDHAPPDERKLKLGKTIRTLHERLPTLLVSPLPQDLLSPQISLHLFPSTHPHLPTVSGKIAYTAALWTAPVAWGRVPVVGNVKLNILSERMVKNGACSADDSRREQLVVKWETYGKSKEKDTDPVSEAFEKVRSIVGGSRQANDEFSGLFIFEFDDEGRIAKHTIEHVENSGHSYGPAKVISVTDWLLGRAWRREEGSPSLAFAKCTKRRHGDAGRGG